ncbi:uncharacterized protein LOC143020226 [Oratosquilla oratoria]|uniref:uncharacterized protein LOC143020226 n=1 Tax=Oratosquilla oratoria TaxID=337810 RepID=UPI003F75B553
MPRGITKDMLLTCTTEAPFKCPQGKMYVQIDGVAMGSPLGVFCARGFMSFVENEVLSPLKEKPHLYLRYVDDIFVCVENVHMLEELRAKLQVCSGLQFTLELNVSNKILFLYVLVDATSDSFTTNIYCNPTDAGKCMNGLGECSQSYKKGVIRANVRGAVYVCSSWHMFHSELKY